MDSEPTGDAAPVGGMPDGGVPGGAGAAVGGAAPVGGGGAGSAAAEASTGAVEQKYAVLGQGCPVDITVKVGDITCTDVDCIVNPAKPSLEGTVIYESQCVNYGESQCVNYGGVRLQCVKYGVGSRMVFTSRLLFLQFLLLRPFPLPPLPPLWSH
jgi:hypothetical protein